MSQCIVRVDFGVETKHNSLVHMYKSRRVAWKLSSMLKRKRLTLEEALEAIDIYLQIPVRFVEVELTESLELADEMNLYAYDACLLRCATKYRLPLLTLDGRLAEAAKGKKIQVLEVEE